MVRRFGLHVAATAAWLAVSLATPAAAQPGSFTGSMLAKTSFVKDSVALLKPTAAATKVVASGAMPTATLKPAATFAGQLAAREIRVRRLSPVAERPVLRAGNELQWQVPLEIRARDRLGASHTLRPQMELVGQGLEWSRVLGRYGGTVRVWLEDQAAPASGYALESPVALEIGGEASSYEPTRWDVPRAGRPSKDVEIAVAGARSASAIQIKVAATSSDQQTTLEDATAAIEMPLTGEPMSVRPERQAVQGWGLESAELTITTSGSPPEQPLSVAVTSRRGMARAQAVPIDAQGNAVARIRSGTPGLDTVWVNLENRYLRFAIVEHQVPWVFLLFAIAGGLLGSFLRTLGRPAGRAKHPARSFWIQQVIGVLCGLLATGLYHVGFPLLPGIATGQTGGVIAAVVAAAAAFLGRDWLAKKLGEA